MTDKGRLHFLDNLKVFLIILVIVHHVGQAYGSTGMGWYYSYPGERESRLGYFFMFNTTFFMGLFFFISGYFFPRSLDHHGPRKFVADKFIRFGIPIVAASLTVLPVLEYMLYVKSVGPMGFRDFYVGQWLKDAPRMAGHHGSFNIAYLWFVEHLLCYSVLYAIVRTVRQRIAPPAPARVVRRAGLSAIIPFIVALGAVTYLMRNTWGFPRDRWIGFLGIILMEPAHLPQYLSLFALGILAYRWSLLDSLSAPRNMLWLLPALGIYTVTIIQIYTSGRASALYLWEYREALLCVGVSIGLLSLFRTFFNRPGRTMQVLSENTFGAYVLHVPVVVALQYAFDPLRAGALSIFAVVSLLSVPATFLVSILARKIPGVGRIL